jgi:hypothetical protein
LIFLEPGDPKKISVIDLEGSIRFVDVVEGVKVLKQKKNH